MKAKAKHDDRNVPAHERVPSHLFPKRRNDILKCAIVIKWSKVTTLGQATVLMSIHDVVVDAQSKYITR